MIERDDAKVSERYRALGREEPGAALDAAILAAARRAAGARPRPARAGLQRWTLPLSLAAVVVLSVTVTLQVQRERPDEVALVAPEPKKIEPSAAREAPAAHAPQPALRKAQPASAERDLARQRTAPEAEQAAGSDTAKAERRLDEARPAQAPASGARAFAPDPASSPEGSIAGRMSAPSPLPAEALADRASAAPGGLARESAEEAASSAQARNEAVPRSAPAAVASRAKADDKDETPERWLERIVALRAAGRDREADESFAEFRKRHPEYRISEEMLGKLSGKR